MKGDPGLLEINRTLKRMVDEVEALTRQVKKTTQALVDLNARLPKEEVKESDG